MALAWITYRTEQAVINIKGDTGWVTGARVSQIANLRVGDLQADRLDPRLMLPSSRKGRGQKVIAHGYLGGDGPR